MFVFYTCVAFFVAQMLLLQWCPFPSRNMLWIVGTAVRCARCGVYTPQAEDTYDHMVCERCVTVGDTFHASFFELENLFPEEGMFDESNISIDSSYVESEFFDALTPVAMYDKLSGVAHFDRTPLLLLDNVWGLLVGQRKLSNCWVECSSGEMVKFGGHPCSQCF